MMIKRILQLILITTIGLLAVAAPVYAVNVSNAAFIADIITKNTGDATTNVAAVVDINTEALIDNKYVTPDLRNTTLQTLEGVEVPYMPGVGDNPWVFWVPVISANEQKCYSLYAGGPPMNTGTGIVYFPATTGENTGMTVPYSESLELGDNFKVTLQGFVNTSAGDNKNLVFNDEAFKIWVSDEKEISVSIYKAGGWDACKVTATNVPSSVLLIEVTGDTEYLRLYVNGMPKGTPVLMNGGVPHSVAGWSFCTNGSMLYLEFLKIWVA